MTRGVEWVVLGEVVRVAPDGAARRATDAHAQADCASSKSLSGAVRTRVAFVAECALAALEDSKDVVVFTTRDADGSVRFVDTTRACSD